MYYETVKDTMSYPLCGFLEVYELVYDKAGEAGDLVEDVDCTFTLEPLLGGVTMSCEADSKKLNDTFIDVHNLCRSAHDVTTFFSSNSYSCIIIIFIQHQNCTCQRTNKLESA